MKRFALGAALLAVLGQGATPAQTDWSEIEVTTTHVAGNVHMLVGAGGNIGVSAGEDGILIVDDQYAPLADKIRAALQEMGKGKLQFILNTHWHGDHVGGNEAFGPEAPIIAHTNVRTRLSTRQEAFGRVWEPLPAEALPVITFDHSVSVHFNGETIEAIHFPRGHTDGDSIIFFTGSNVVHMGDSFWGGGKFPRVDLETGGTVDGFLHNLGGVIERVPDDVKIIPGHGPLSTKADLEAAHENLTETVVIVRKGMESGKSLEDLRNEGFPEKYESWGTGFISADVWIETIYTSLSPRIAP